MNLLLCADQAVNAATFACTLYLRLLVFGCFCCCGIGAAGADSLLLSVAPAAAAAPFAALPCDISSRVGAASSRVLSIFGLRIRGGLPLSGIVTRGTFRGIGATGWFNSSLRVADEFCTAGGAAVWSMRLNLVADRGLTGVVGDVNVVAATGCRNCGAAPACRDALIANRRSPCD